MLLIFLAFLLFGFLLDSGIAYSDVGLCPETVLLMLQ